MSREILRVGGLRLELEHEGEALRSIRLPDKIPSDFDGSALREVLDHLGQRTLLTNQGGPFIQKVRARMSQIPLGTALTYGELADAVGNPRAVRAVGQACATNPLPLIVPCHRVVAKDGLGGFSCGLHWKVKLLELESALAHG